MKARVHDRTGSLFIKPRLGWKKGESHPWMSDDGRFYTEEGACMFWSTKAERFFRSANLQHDLLYVPPLVLIPIIEAQLKVEATRLMKQHEEEKQREETADKHIKEIEDARKGMGDPGSGGTS